MSRASSRENRFMSFPPFKKFWGLLFRRAASRKLRERPGTNEHATKQNSHQMAGHQMPAAHVPQGGAALLALGLALGAPVGEGTALGQVDGAGDIAL